jgi:hypothetical protein
MPEICGALFRHAHGTGTFPPEPIPNNKHRGHRVYRPSRGTEIHSAFRCLSSRLGQWRVAGKPGRFGMKKLALALAATAALGMAAPSDAQAWGYRYGGWGGHHGGWGGVGAGLAIGALAGGLIAASTGSAYAYPTYSYGGYYPASYGYGYPAGYGYDYAPTQVVVVRRRVVAPAYYGGYYPASYGYGGYYGGYGVRRVGYYGGYYRPRVAHYGGYGFRRVGYYGGGYWR